MMKQFKKRLLAIVACIAMVVSVLPQAGWVYAAETAEAVEYQIYPTPHSIEYAEDSFVIRSNVNVVLESGIDEVTADKLENVLGDKGIAMSESDEVSDSTTNILVGIKDSAGYVDAYADANVTYSEETFAANHYGAYVLDVNNGTITILGADTDAAFYGVVSLMHILNQLDGKTIRNLTMEDYADTAIRGFIEGYYGVPWSNEDRMSLMEFGGQFKMTSYIFAPKDDPYHTSRWRELYPAEEIAAIAEMVEVGNANKCRFVWTAHPFMGGFNSNDVDGEIDALLNKFDQLYSVGVRQFGVLGDDVGSLNRSVVIQVMRAVSAWANEKGDVYDSVFCPAGYNHSWQGDYSELNDYDAGFPDDVQIFWTGEAVCQPVEQRTLDHFRNQNASNGERRSPLFWLNWPVNDINMSRLMMGKGSLLHTDVAIEDLAGVVTNPMQDAEASKVALFAIADYAWNIRAFDDDQSWADSFAYIDEDASEELHTLAKHMSDPSPNGHGLNLAESEELSPLLDAYLGKVENGSLTAADSDAIIAEFEIIAEACDAFHQKSQNEKLKEELLPFTNSLKDQALAAIAFVNTQKAIDAGNASEVWSSYSQATALLTSSKTYHRVTLGGTKEALPGSKHVTPFIESLSSLLSPTVNSMIDDSKQIITLITNRTDTPNGALDKLTDNNASTEVIWSNPNSTTAGTYIGLTYTQPITLNNVTFKMGQSGNDRDTFDAGKLQYTVDGKVWIDIEGTEFTSRVNDVKAEGLDLEVKGVRIISTADKGNMWLGCKDIIVNASTEEPEPTPEPTTVTGTGFYNTENMGVENGNVGMFTDGNTNDYAGFGYVDGGDYTVAGAWVGLQFEGTETISSVNIVQGSGDHIDEGTLEYLNESDVWTPIGTYTGIGEVFAEEFEPVQAKAVRLVNNVEKAIWWRIYEFTVEKPAEGPTDVSSVAKTAIYNQENMGVEWGTLGMFTDGNTSDYAGFGYVDGGDYTVAGAWVGLEFAEAVTINSVNIVQGSGDHIDAGTLEYLNESGAWTAIDTYTGIGEVFAEEFEPVQAKGIRLVNNEQKAIWWRIYEFSVDYQPKDESAVTEGILTNISDVTGLSVDLDDDTATLAGPKSITLAPGEYIGIELDRIKDITNIAVSENNDALTLETSKNNVVWTAVGDTYEDARYVRVINNTDSPVTFNFNSLTVESFEISGISVEGTNFGQTSTHLLAFDQDRTTEAVLQASQYAGQYITYDLGQVIDLDSLKLVLHDGTTDYPRHAKVSVSVDGTTWTEVMLIGNQDSANPGEAENTDNIQELFPDHETSYYTKSVTGLDQDVRYIKFEITRTKEGADKWVRIREIELNGGNMYLPSENNPTIIVDGEESTGNVPANMIDGDVSTTFKSAVDEAGSFTYSISENTEIGKITILQSPATISGATVSAEVVENGAVKTVELGKLVSSLNEFNTTAFDHVLAITVTWEAGNVPEIHEIITSRTTGNADKSELEAYYNSVKDTNTSTWTPNSQAAFASAIDVAEYVLGNAYASQNSVNSALAELQAAVDGKIVKPDMAAFEASVAEITKDVQDEEDYLARTWKPYADAMSEVEAAKANAEVSQTELDEILADVTAAVEGLVYEVASIEELEVLAADAKAQYDAEDYTEESFAALTNAIADAEAMVEADAAERQNPDDVKACIAALEAAIEGLKVPGEPDEPEKPVVDKTEAQRYYDECLAFYKEENHSEDSWESYQTAMADLKAVLEDDDTTEEELRDALVALIVATDVLNEELEAEKPDGSVEPDQPDEPIAPELPDEDKSTATGDSASVMTWVMVMVFAGAVIFLTKKRARI